MGAKFVSFSQIPNGAIFHLPGDNTVKGQLFVSDTAYHLTLYNKTVLSFSKYDALKAYLPEEIYLFSNGKFNYKKGFLFGLEATSGINHVSSNLSVTYTPNFHGIEYGMNIGSHLNFVDFSAITNWVWLDVSSFTVSGLIKYYPLQTSLRRPYVKASVGHASNSIPNFAGNTTIKNSAVLEFGLGYTFSSKSRTKWYVELTQYNMKINGTFTDNVNTNQGVAPITEFDIWLNRLMLRFGFVFGK